MVTGMNIAYRCLKCNEVFFKSRNDLLDKFKKLLGLLSCPYCGSEKVIEDTTIKT